MGTVAAPYALVPCGLLYEPRSRAISRNLSVSSDRNLTGASPERIHWLMGGIHQGIKWASGIAAIRSLPFSFHLSAFLPSLWLICRPVFPSWWQRWPPAAPGYILQVSIYRLIPLQPGIAPRSWPRAPCGKSSEEIKQAVGREGLLSWVLRGGDIGAETTCWQGAAWKGQKESLSGWQNSRGKIPEARESLADLIWKSSQSSGWT